MPHRAPTIPEKNMPVSRSTSWARRPLLSIHVLFIGMLLAGVGNAAATAADPLCIRVELFVDGQDASTEQTIAAVRGVTEGRRGIVLSVRDIAAMDADRRQVEVLAARYGLPPNSLPWIRACNAVSPLPTDNVPKLTRAIGSLLEIEVFTRQGCLRCTKAKEWLPELAARYPGLRVAQLDLTADATAREYLSGLVRKHGTAAASVPVFHVGGQLVVGFDRPETTGRRIEGILSAASCPCPPPHDPPAGRGERRLRPSQARFILVAAGSETVESVSHAIVPEVDSGSIQLAEPVDEDDGIDLPLFGRVSSRGLGMPLFTTVVGLVDGFNPCAMWVLIFLLSILVNLQDRTKILAIAGTFVLVSGLAYFAFMAAWLNVFVFIGMLRPVQVALATTAIVIGCIHVKDFFAYGRGPSLSIPESAKPGIYDRVRRIVMAENLLAAVAGAFVLAVLVNIVELLCTAGLPALYTSILSRQGYGPAVRYGYLALYIAAYMFDDALMVGIMTATLSRRRLQQSEGRWLKLVSGAVILLLGLVMLFRPDLLE